jgi:hypothetical protein
MEWGKAAVTRRASSGVPTMETSSFPDTSLQSSHTADLQERIRRRAEEIYYRNGQLPGRDAENWAQAEHEIQLELANDRRRTAIVVNVNGVQYIGEYRRELADGYAPGEFDPGASVAVRLVGDKMFVIRPNGKELETTIVRRVG